MDLASINHWAVWLCAALNLVLGAIWYSPALFFESWKKANQLTDADFEHLNYGKVYTISFVLALVISYNMAMFLAGPGTDWLWGMTAGFLAGFGWCAMIFAAIALFELKTKAYIGINGGYIVVYFTLIGLILGAWR